MDTDKFIKLVKKYPILYNRHHKEYTNVAKKSHIWENIAKEMDLSSDLAKVKWKGLKDSYNKYQKDNKGVSGSTKYFNWCWGPYLTFLDNCSSKRNVIRNLRKYSPSPTSPTEAPLAPIKIEIESDEDEQDSTSLTFVTPTPSTMLRSSKLVRRNPLSTQSDDDDESSLQLPNKRTKTDAVDHLFKSYSETFKKFSVCTQAKLKVEMAKLFADAEVEEYNQMNSSTHLENYEQEGSLKEY